MYRQTLHRSSVQLYIVSITAITFNSVSGFIVLHYSYLEFIFCKFSVSPPTLRCISCYILGFANDARHHHHIHSNFTSTLLLCAECFRTCIASIYSWREKKKVHKIVREFMLNIRKDRYIKYITLFKKNRVRVVKVVEWPPHTSNANLI